MIFFENTSALIAPNPGNQFSIILNGQFFEFKLGNNVIPNKAMFIVFVDDADAVAAYPIVDACYRPPEGGRLCYMKVVSSYVFLRTYYV